MALVAASKARKSASSYVHLVVRKVKMGEQGKADKYKSVQHLGGESSLVTVFFYLFIDIMRCVCVFCPVGVMIMIMWSKHVVQGTKY